MPKSARTVAHFFGCSKVRGLGERNVKDEAGGMPSHPSSLAKSGHLGELQKRGGVMVCA